MSAVKLLLFPLTIAVALLGPRYELWCLDEYWSDTEDALSYPAIGLIAGPCSVESEEQIMKTARAVKAAGGSITEAQALGHVGITEVICLMGFYTSVSMTLTSCDVPAGAEGLAR